MKTYLAFPIDYSLDLWYNELMYDMPKRHSGKINKQELAGEYEQKIIGNIFCNFSGSVICNQYSVIKIVAQLY